MFGYRTAESAPGAGFRLTVPFKQKTIFFLKAKHLYGGVSWLLLAISNGVYGAAFGYSPGTLPLFVVFLFPFFL